MTLNGFPENDGEDQLDLSSEKNLEVLHRVKRKITSCIK
jgi:hypothetical protein